MLQIVTKLLAATLMDAVESAPRFTLTRPVLKSVSKKRLLASVMLTVIQLPRLVKLLAKDHTVPRVSAWKRVPA
jgi:hypothetical protein